MGAERDALDSALDEIGQTATLKRRIGTTAVYDQVTCRIVLRKADPHPLVGDIERATSAVIMSPTEIADAGWPASAGGPAYPAKGDILIINDTPRNVVACAPFKVLDEIVRLEVVVQGYL